MIRVISAILLCLALAFVAEASSCRVVAVRGHHVQNVIHHAGVQHHAAAIVQPLYSIGYQPDLSEVVKELIQDNKAMREQLIQALKAPSTIAPGGEPLPLKAGGAPPAQASCVSCHNEAVAKAKGGGEVFYREGVLIENQANVDRMLDAVTETQSMPRGKKWSAQDQLDFIRSFRGK